jgi:hypothetical protein
VSGMEQNAERLMRVYRALRVTGRVAKLMRSQGMKAACAVNPAVLAVDAALAVLDAGRAYFRLSAERERTLGLENNLKAARARLAADAKYESDTIAVSQKRMARGSDVDGAVMSSFRLLELATKTLGEEMAKLAGQEGDLRLVSLTRKYEIFMSRYMRTVEQLSLAATTEVEG